MWPMRIACCIPKATNTHSEYVIFIAFPQQQWLHEGASLLRHTYSTVPVFVFSVIVTLYKYVSSFYTIKYPRYKIITGHMLQILVVF